MILAEWRIGGGDCGGCICSDILLCCSSRRNSASRLCTASSPTRPSLTLCCRRPSRGKTAPSTAWLFTLITITLAILLSPATADEVVSFRNCTYPGKLLPLARSVTFADLTSTTGSVSWGASLDTKSMTVDDYVLSLGENRAPTILNLYVDAAHLEDSPNESLNCQIAATKAAGAILMLTIEPWDGLHTIDSATTTYLARLCRDINDAGVGVFVRFAHEMNGDWYPWGARPGEYRDTYRAVAAAVKAAAENTVMVWAPNTGMGYPYNGAGKYLPTDTEGSRFKQMDTNRDGVLDRGDDPFAPYYPGDDVVDWIGVSLYSKRDKRKSDDDANKVAERGLLNKYINNPGTEYNLYELYAKEKNKPFMIAETASAFYPDFPEGDGEVAIKRQWWRQFWSPETLNEYPLLKATVWFEFTKTADTGEVRDYTITRKEEVLNAFLEDAKKTNAIAFLNRETQNLSGGTGGCACTQPGDYDGDGKPDKKKGMAAGFMVDRCVLLLGIIGMVVIMDVGM